MVRGYILFGLLIAGFLPACINAAEQPAENKPTLLIINDCDQKTFYTVGFFFKSFNDWVTGLVQRDFRVESKIMDDVLSGDLRKANYVLIVATAMGFDEKSIKTSLQKTGLGKVDNKALVVLGFYSDPVYLVEMSNRFKRLFSDRVYQLHYYAENKLYQNSEYDKFTSFVRSLHEQFPPLQVQVGQPLSLPEQEKMRAREALQLSLDDFYWELYSLNEQLAAKYVELIKQLQQQDK